MTVDSSGPGGTGVSSSRSRTLIVTGVDGFVGRHVVVAARAQGFEVHAIVRNPVDDELTAQLASVRVADLTAGWPDDLPHAEAIIHLAALSSVGGSFERPQAYINDNSAMVTQLCEALLAAGEPLPRVLAISSGAIYGSANGSDPRDENARIGYSSPYVVSKLLVEDQLRYYSSRGLPAVVARPFNHIGPGQNPGFLVPDLTERLLALPPGAALRAGNLDSRRDYTDVRDVARAYVRLVSEETSEITFNIASGRSISGHEILAMICSALGRDVPPLVDDARLHRPSDDPEVVGNASRLAAAVGWHPEVSIEQSITDFVTWRLERS